MTLLLPLRFSQRLLICILTFTLTHSAAHAAITLRGGHIVSDKDIATMSVQEHYSAGLEAYKNEDWRETVAQFRIVTSAFPDTQFAADGLFYLSVGYYRLEEFEFANKYATAYLGAQNNPKHYESAMRVKYCCAEAFRLGARRRILGSAQMPKWVAGYRLSGEIYDDVIMGLPSHPLGAKALYGKGQLLGADKNYQEAIETYQALIRRFPKHELAPEAFVAISHLYHEQALTEFQNPDLIALSQINATKFEQAFPGDERLDAIHSEVAAITESYASGIYDTGKFYEKVKKPQAAVLYYRKAATQFPQTQIAVACRERLRALQPIAEEMGIALEEIAPPSETVQ